MLDEGALAISIPALEWRGTRPPGSVFFRRDIAGQPFSAPLLRALDLISSASAHAGFEPVFVARPEIFTHGVSLAWLMAKLGPIRDHLSFSDGTTIKLIPGLRNHVFFYGLSRQADGEALYRLIRRFPELFETLSSQVNSALRLGSDAESPPPVAVQAAPQAATKSAFYPIALHAHSAAESTKSALLGRPRIQLPRGFDELTYVPLTEASLRDRDFMRTIAAVFDESYFASARALVIRLPEAFGESSDVQDRLEACLVALAEAGSRAPLAPAANGWFATEDVSGATLAAAAASTNFLGHSTFDFWRAPPSDYRLFRTRRIVAKRGQNLIGEFGDLIEALCGAEAEILWRDADNEAS